MLRFSSSPPAFYRNSPHSSRLMQPNGVGLQDSHSPKARNNQGIHNIITAAVGLMVNTEHFRIIVYMPPCCHCMLLGEQLYEVKRSLSTVRYKTISKARVRRSPREAGGIPAAQRRSLSGSGGGGAAPLRGSGRAAAAAPGANGGRGCEAAAAVRQKRMKEVDNLESIKEEWVCESGSDNQCHNNNRQTNCEYFVDSLFEEAQKVGAKCLSPTEQKKQVDVSIKLWKNGFTVNDDFRSYSDGASQQFLNSIKKGELPSELQGVFDKEEVDVKVEDKKNEVCLSTKPVFQPFSGQGHRLGSATPKIVSKTKILEVENKSNLSTVPLNNLEPITNVRIWLANGKRIVQKFNISHRVSHIKDFIEKYQGSQRSPPFSLATALPFLRSLDETLTLEEADLQNAVIIQRLQKTVEPFRELP